MNSKQKTFIIAIVLAVVLVIGLGFLINKPAGPSKYTDFAKTLVADGAQFYGAFWCPHCQAQEAALGISRQDLETMGLYHECSNADKSQTQGCIDKKVESYPTWYFKNGITTVSATDPTICKPVPAGSTVDATENPICKQISSQYFTVYLFTENSFGIRTDTPPVKTGNTWKFPPTASTTGELPLPFLASQIGYTLPQ
jgi:thiol-disulfide isomerase/thioredoxin